MTTRASVEVWRGKGGTPINPGARVLTNIKVQIDNMSMEMATEVVGTAKGASPFDAYLIYVIWANSPTMIQRSDVLVDLATPDPVNPDLATYYRIVGNVAYFSDDHHMELKAIRIYGT